MAPLLDNTSLGLIFRDTKDKGRESLRVLREHCISKGRPQIVIQYITLTSLQKTDTETVTEYIIRAEQVREGLMMAMVMRGLPEIYKPFMLMVTHGSLDMKLRSSRPSCGTLRPSEDSDLVLEEVGERVLKEVGPPNRSGVLAMRRKGSLTAQRKLGGICAKTQVTQTKRAERRSMDRTLNRDKLDSRSKRRLFVGHGKGGPAFLVYYHGKGKSTDW